MRKSIHNAAMLAGSFVFLSSTSALAASDQDVAGIRKEIQAMKQSYENRINDLESKLAQMEQKKPVSSVSSPRDLVQLLS